MTENPVSVSQALTLERPVVSPRRLILPLALAQFICSFAGSNMNVMINDISDDLDTTVKGVQTTITLFLLIMAILMIPCSKLTERWGRKRCFTWGLTLYGIGALLSSLSPNLGLLILGNSVFEGVGTALLIPPVYILATLWFSDLTSRAWAFGVISGLGGIGAAAGPLIGGIITTGISWRAAFIFQALVIVTIIFLSRRLVDPLPPDPKRPFDAIQTGVIFTAATVGILVSSLAAERLAKKYRQKSLIVGGFVVTLAGIGLLLGLVYVSTRNVAFVPGLLLIGLGLGGMLTPSVNVVQSSFPEQLQGEISGLSRSVSNLGSSFGTAIAGTILVSVVATGNRAYTWAMVAVAVFGLIGLGAAILLPGKPERQVG